MYYSSSTAWKSNEIVKILNKLTLLDKKFCSVLKDEMFMDGNLCADIIPKYKHLECIHTFHEIFLVSLCES